MGSIVPLFAVAFAAAAPALATEAVPVPSFRSVELRGGGEINVVPGPAQRVTILQGSSHFPRMRVECDGKLMIDGCVERCPSHFDVRMQIQSPRVPNLAISGGGMIATRGNFAPQPSLAAAIHGGGKIDARSVEARTVSAAVNGGGEVVVNARGMLSAAINGGGMVRYVGNPHINSAIHGGGLVRSVQ
jgi:hypothetical protein